jgi:hypothetical protein
MKSRKSQTIGKGEIMALQPREKKVGTEANARADFAEEHARKAAGENEASDPVTETYGCLGSKTETDTVIAELRDE